MLRGVDGVGGGGGGGGILMAAGDLDGFVTSR
jgi:hypothetical protein